MAAPAEIARSLERLFLRTTHGIRPGLDTVAALARELGDPQRAFLCVHVAGTNGKGSVCAMVESVLRAAGIRTGLYTSPHLVRFHERIRVDGRPVDDAALAACLERAEAAAARIERGGGLRPATFFELTTAMAFDHFRASGVQVAVVETGMGGRWDATNVVRPVVSAICEVDLDHQDYLGPTLAQIAGEKCGIIKEGRPVVCAPQREEVLAQVRAEAGARHAPLTLAGDAVRVRRIRQDWDGQRLAVETSDRAWPGLRLPLLGRHQLGNVAVALAALDAFAAAAGLALDPEAVRRGFETVRWPARLQVLSREPPVLLDSAHNPHAARALAGALRELRGRRKVGLVCGVLADKDAAGWLRALAPRVDRCWTVPLEGPRGRTAEDLAAVAATVGLAAAPGPLPAAWEEARAWAAREGGLVCAAGSLYLAGEVLRRYADGERLFEC